MLNTAKLRGLIAERGLTQSKVAGLLGLTPRGFYNKMHAARFTCDELEALVKLLHIRDPWETLFEAEIKEDGQEGA